MKQNAFAAIKDIARQILCLGSTRSAGKRVGTRRLSCQTLQSREVMAAGAFEFCEMGNLGSDWIPLAGDWDGTTQGGDHGGGTIPEVVDFTDQRRNDRDFSRDGLGAIPRQLTDNGLVSQILPAAPITRSTDFKLGGYVGNGGGTALYFDSRDEYEFRVARAAEVTIRLDGYDQPVGLTLSPGGKVLEIRDTGPRVVTVNVPADGRLWIQVVTSTFSLTRDNESQNYDLDIEVRMN
ncbi:MAG: hypothetical protein AAF802_15900 [Planctomycetota bacterium]